MRTEEVGQIQDAHPASCVKGDKNASGCGMCDRNCLQPHMMACKVRRAAFKAEHKGNHSPDGTDSAVHHV